MKFEQRTVPDYGLAYVLLMQPWQDGRLAHSPPLGFEQTLLGGHSFISSLAPGTSSSVRLCIHSRRLLDL